MKHYLLIFLFLLPFFCFAQKHAKHDSIMNEIESASHDTTKASYYLNLGDLYHYSQLDSALKFYNKALDLARESSHKHLEAKSYNYIGIIYLYQSEFDKTVNYFQKSLELKKEIGDQAGMANSYNNLGIIAKNRGNLGEALGYYNNVLNIRKELLSESMDGKASEDNLKNIGHAYMNIGNVYFQLGDYHQALMKYKESLVYYDSIQYEKGISGCYNNIGSIFEEQKNFDKAIDYYKQSLEINLKIGEVRNIGTCYNNIGEIYLKRSQLQEATRYFQKSLQYRSQINDQRGISAVYSNLAMVYYKKREFDDALEMINKALKIDHQIGDKKGASEDLNYLAKIHLAKHEYLQAVEMANKSLDISASIKTPLQSKESHELLAEAYEKQGDFVRALEHHKLFKQFEDELFNKEKHEQIEELEQKYQAEKSKQQIEKQNVLLEKQQAVIKQQNTMKIVYLVGTFFLLVLTILIYWNYRQKQNANRVLTLQKEEIQTQNEKLQQQNEEIITQRDELEKQRDLANYQRNAIATKNDEITSSIQYAKSIQSAVLPQEYHISRILEDYFILFKPKDIVSGDFYWINEKDNKKIVAAVDCTGHGVPGAFMSLLGMSLLNDIVDEIQEVEANEILNILRTRLIQSLHQKGLNEENRDGMDLALIVYDEKSNELQYSGAYNPMFLVREGKTIEYKPNRMSISIQSKLDQSFHNNHIPLQKGDTIYLATDGYADQISGETHKKMTRGRFKQYLATIAHHSLDKQEKELNQYFENWKGEYEQVDDVLVIGLRF